LPLDTMAQQQRLQIEAITPVGDDWRIDAKAARP
jgi:diaminohydroxyphosphoribosylaminopyrimidine deaminase/5-amino-6-(5-phosphoribosylamino)uracil reductase